MENFSKTITFSYFGKDKYILHINDERHFIIDSIEKSKIELILCRNDENLKSALIEKISKINNKEKNRIMFLSDFQFKKILISQKSMKKVCQPFTFLYNKYILITMPLLLFTALTYFYFFHEPVFFNNKVPFMKLSWIIIGFVFFVHEIGHASACLKFGANVSEIGFGITSFFPVMYANISGAWKLSKAQRIIVNLGGIYFQNLMSLIILMCSLIIDTSELYIIGKLIFISTIFQFFPFHKSDGYWILSDVLSQPNLLQKSRRFFLTLIKNPFSKREKKDFFFLIYYLMLSGIMYYFLIRMGVRYYYYIINIPFFLVDLFKNILENKINNTHFDITYLWAIIYLIFTSKIIINNIKIYRLSNGADER
jgi:putative peptide zinc metalloprotease protein